MKLVNGIRDIIDDYDIWILDMWGVMHDGFNPYEGVVDVVRRLKEAGKTMIILSNSSQRKSNSIKNLSKLGFDPVEDNFSQIITSGEVAFQLLQSQSAGKTQEDNGFQLSWNILNQKLQNKQQNSKPKVFVLGSGTLDDFYCNESGWELSSVEEADLLLARGTFTVNDGSTEINKREDPEAYEKAVSAALQTAATKKIPM